MGLVWLVCGCRLRAHPRARGPRSPLTGWCAATSTYSHRQMLTTPCAASDPAGGGGGPCGRAIGPTLHEFWVWRSSADGEAERVAQRGQRCKCTTLGRTARTLAQPRATMPCTRGPSPPRPFNRTTRPSCDSLRVEFGTRAGARALPAVGGQTRADCRVWSRGMMRKASF